MKAFVEQVRATIELVEARVLMAGDVLGGCDHTMDSLVVTTSDIDARAHAGGGGGGAGKVSMNDFHFVMRSTASGGGAGKVSMQDFHFVMRNNSLVDDDVLVQELSAAMPSGSSGGGTGKVSMQDFHFVSKASSSSPGLALVTDGTSLEFSTELGAVFHAGGVN